MKSIESKMRKVEELEEQHKEIESERERLLSMQVEISQRKRDLEKEIRT